MNNANKPTSEVIKNFMQMTDCNEVFLYGGAAIDRYLNPECKIMDYDIAIKDLEVYRGVIAKLHDHHFDIGTPRLSHNLATVAKHKDLGVFDLSCMDIKQNGIFNIEKFYIEYSSEYPRGKAVDAYGAVAGLREGRVEIANDPSKEKAYDLLRRFSVLAGKYGFSLERGGKNEQTIAIIESRLKETPLSKKNEHSRVRCLSRFLGAALRSSAQHNYFDSMAQTGLLTYGFPELNKTLLNKDFQSEITAFPATDKFDLIEKMLRHAPNRDAFIDEISILKNREKDREDPRVINRMESFTQEKTSYNRLYKSIISPLLNKTR